ncbi:MAG: ABC transporter ATP-binding protein [Chloroflexi bacterium]|nr:ABC transporter ATP-binding protein [Chloroflexota bacterium]
MSADGRPAAHLVVSGVTAGYGPTPTIVDMSASVGHGEVACIIGPNGAGKSTFLKAIVGMLRATSGSVTLGGADITNLAPERLARRGVGYVPQVNDIFDPLTVAENIEMGGYLLRSAEVRDRMAGVLAVFPALGEMLGRRALKLSGGERKMLAIARVLMLEPEVLILDEPTANLSPKLATVLLRDHVRRLADAGTAVLLVEQRAAAALEISDWAYVMVSGTASLDGSARELLARRDFGQVFLGQAPAAAVSQPGGMDRDATR